MSQLGGAINVKEAGGTQIWLPFKPRVFSDAGVNTITYTAFGRYSVMGGGSRVIQVNYRLAITAFAGAAANVVVSPPFGLEEDQASVADLTGLSHMLVGCLYGSNPPFIFGRPNNSGLNGFIINKYDGTSMWGVTGNYTLSGTYVRSLT